MTDSYKSARRLFALVGYLGSTYSSAKPSKHDIYSHVEGYDPSHPATAERMLERDFHFLQSVGFEIERSRHRTRGMAWKKAKAGWEFGYRLVKSSQWLARQAPDTHRQGPPGKKRVGENLLALLEELRPRRWVSGQDLQQRLGVARVTIKAYIATLRQIGIPIQSRPGGRGENRGGYRLRPGFILPTWSDSQKTAMDLHEDPGNVLRKFLVERQNRE